MKNAVIISACASGVKSVDSIKMKYLSLNTLKSINFFCFDEISEMLYDFFHSSNSEMLSEINFSLITIICEYLNIKTKISSCTEFSLEKEKNQRLISICEQTEADIYLSGYSAKEYIDMQSFTDSGIKIEWFDYEGYPKYEQLWGKFIHEVTILDLLFNCGKKSPSFMKKVSVLK